MNTQTQLIKHVRAYKLRTWSDSTHVMAAKNPKSATVRKTSWPLNPGCRMDFPRARRAITHKIRHNMYPKRIQYDMKIGCGQNFCINEWGCVCALKQGRYGMEALKSVLIANLKIMKQQSHTFPRCQCKQETYASKKVLACSRLFCVFAMPLGMHTTQISKIEICTDLTCPN